MKVKLTPALAYLIGLWRKTKSFEGVGVHGDQPLLEVFTKEALDQKLTTTEKIVSEERRVYFFHTAYKKFFSEVEKEQLERFKYLNEYAAYYLAGLFDAVGEIDEKGVVCLGKLNRQDEMLLLRLGFGTRLRGEKRAIEKPVLFLAFIKNYVKLKKDLKAFELIKAQEVPLV